MYVPFGNVLIFLKVFVRSFIHSFVVESRMREAEFKQPNAASEMEVLIYTISSRIDILIFSESYEWDIVTVKICKFIYR